MKRTKYVLVIRDGEYSPIATTQNVAEYMQLHPEYLGQVSEIGAITVAEIKKKGIRIYSQEFHESVLDRDARREALFSWAKSVKSGTVRWFDKGRGEGMIECEGQTLPIYACNIKGRKTWYPETACVYYEAGQVVDCHITVQGYNSVFCIGDTQGTFDEEGWNRIKDQPLAFKCNEDGEAINGLFE